VNERAAKARPDDAQAQAQLGYSYLLLGRLEEAETHLKRTASLDPANYYYPQILLADIYSQRGDNASMVRELEEFLRLHPDSQKARDVTRILDRLRSQLKKTAVERP
jgi:tetratricopeptide (TPR) repeat protein